MAKYNNTFVVNAESSAGQGGAQGFDVVCRHLCGARQVWPRFSRTQCLFPAAYVTLSIGKCKNHAADEHIKPYTHRCSIKLLLQRLSVLYKEEALHQDANNPTEKRKDEEVTHV